MGIKLININKETLYQKYVIEGKSIAMISEDLKCSPPTIHERLKEYGLNRNKSEAQIIKCNRDGVHNGFSLDEELLKKLYLEDKLTSYEVAEKMKCSQHKVLKSLNKLGITRSISEVMIGKTPWNKNTKMSEETKIKIKEKLKGREGYWSGKNRSPEDKKKMRLSAIKRITNNIKNGNQITPNYNKQSILLLEKYSKLNGYVIQHAENGGEFYIKELGYWVDAYDKNKNVVIEFDERYHNGVKQKENNRQNEIIKQLNCCFIRLNEDGEEILKLKYNGK